MYRAYYLFIYCSMTLTKQDALDAIAKIENVKWDDEDAHWTEDKLMSDFITSCSL